MRGSSASGETGTVMLSRREFISDPSFVYATPYLTLAGVRLRLRRRFAFDKTISCDSPSSSPSIRRLPGGHPCRLETLCIGRAARSLRARYRPCRLATPGVLAVPCSAVVGALHSPESLAAAFTSPRQVLLRVTHVLNDSGHCPLAGSGRRAMAHHPPFPNDGPYAHAETRAARSADNEAAVGDIEVAVRDVVVAGSELRN